MTRLALLAVVAWGFTGMCPTGLQADEVKEKAAPVKIDGLTSTPPANWKEEKPTSRLRAKQFRVPHADADKDDAEVVIFYFGKGVGGSIDDNLGRWKAQFYPPKGKKIDDVTKIEKMKGDKVPFTAVEIHGTYKGSGFVKMDPKPNYRSIKVYFASENGPYFISLTGPEKTVDMSRKAFLSWVKAFK